MVSAGLKARVTALTLNQHHTSQADHILGQPRHWFASMILLTPQANNNPELTRAVKTTLASGVTSQDYNVTVCSTGKS